MTKSISAEASKFLLNETVQPYPGEDYEKVLLYLFTALNNVRQGKTQDALVEARRADEFLKKMRIEYEKDGGIGTIYTEDAFMLWVVGLFYEIEGSWNDASLAYKAAYQAYETNYQSAFKASPPSFVVDVSEHHERKMQALACYHSQFVAGRLTTFPTHLDDIRDRARYWGWTIGTSYGEPLLCREPVGLRSLRDLI